MRINSPAFWLVASFFHGFHDFQSIRGMRWKSRSRSHSSLNITLATWCWLAEGLPHSPVKQYGENCPPMVPASLTLDRLETVLTYETLETKNADMAIAKLLRDGRAKKDPPFHISSYDIGLIDAPQSANHDHIGSPPRVQQLADDLD